jgi:DNA polymerase-3 subunit epsilon
MKVLVFDTETTGLPQKTEDNKEPSIFDFNKWPHIIQISCILYDTEKNDVIVKNYYIKIANDIIITPGSFEKHNLTHEYLNLHGINITTALKEFNRLVYLSDVMVGHNISFDKRMVFVECLKNKIPQHFTKYARLIPVRKAEFCTMKKTTKFCDIVRYSNKTGRTYIKAPSLSELYLILFPDSELPNDLHNSLVDVLITLKCYIKFNYNSNIMDVNDTIKHLCIKFNCV